MQLLSPKEIKNWKGRFIDVRNLEEFAAERLEQCQCVPLNRLMEEAGKWDLKEPVLVMCKSGMRSDQAARQLEQSGFTQVYMLQGGIEACKKAGLDVTVLRKSIPIIRQVLIAASLILITGLALSFISPWFIVVTWFVSIMMMIAGLTGFCPMMIILQHMPWNKVPQPATITEPSGPRQPSTSCCS